MFLQKFSNSIDILLQLRLSQSIHYILYQLGLRIKYFLILSKIQNFLERKTKKQISPNWFLLLPDKKKYQQQYKKTKKSILNKANAILNGTMLYFGTYHGQHSLKSPSTLNHWSQIQLDEGRYKGQDIKIIWEPARFGWLYDLARAYYLTNDDIYAQFFWEKLNCFAKHNPPHQGVNWISAQEVALRIIAFIFAAHIFSDAPSTNVQNIHLLTQMLISHALRIPPTSSYAKAQNNNHLISEAVGLFTAGVFLKHHPRAKKWRKLGWKWFNQAIYSQIDSNGSYIQHSAYYHRLMLDLCLWMWKVTQDEGLTIPTKTKEKIGKSCEWLIALMDYHSGETPNLGHNDGSNVFPLTECKYVDFRPTAQAASLAFLDKQVFPNGKWDELGFWFNLINNTKNSIEFDFKKNPSIHRIGNHSQWARMQAVFYHERPAHADQLHVDIWHYGNAITLDAGTYSYNELPPWNNGLASTIVHNTVAIDYEDQMRYSGRFLWLDWAQPQIINTSDNQITASHDGYKGKGLIHQRTLMKRNASHWIVTDKITSNKPHNKQHTISLHWLFPDWEWIQNNELIVLIAPFGKINVSIKHSVQDYSISIIRAGQLLSGKTDTSPIMGWHSPSYGKKIPALSLLYTAVQKPPIEIITSISIE